MLRFLHLVAFTQSFVFSQVEKKERVLGARGGAGEAEIVFPGRKV